MSGRFFMLEIFSDTSLLLAIGIAFISTLIQSLTGFGFAIVSTPLLLMVYDAKESRCTFTIFICRS